MDQLIDIVLPKGQLEGTTSSVSDWLVKQGGFIKINQPILELETDKVSMELPSPATGILQEVIIQVGEDVAENMILGRISLCETPTAIDHESSNAYLTKPGTLVSKRPIAIKTSPAVRHLIKKHNLDLNAITGSGKDNRVTRVDVMEHLKEAPKAATASTTSSLRPHSKIRQRIASHMVQSLMQISPHVTSVFQMDMSNIIAHRRWHKKEFLEKNIKLTFTSYFLAASCLALKQVPEVNSRFHQDHLELFHDINIGIATALGENGLIVPVIHRVQGLDLLQLSTSLQDKVQRAHQQTLTPSDLSNGTFTLSNHGVSGSLIATPIIINQPQVAILGVGKMEKRVIVKEINGSDSIEIRPMCYVSLSIDHRALDAFHANKFLSIFVGTIENWGT